MTMMPNLILALELKVVPESVILLILNKTSASTNSLVGQLVGEKC